jgi:peptidoglycan/xylan/chitin deacetylase (PgdA/CDA1 family)
MLSLHEQGYQSIIPDDLAAHLRYGKPLPEKPIIITFDDGYLDSVTVAEPILARYGFRAIVYLITGKISDTTQTRAEYEGAPCLTWPEVQAAEARGTLVFGSHTHAHANLAALTRPHDELLLSRDRVRDHTKSKCDGLCYPYGQYRSNTVTVAREAGYTTAVTCREGIARIDADTDLLQLPRVSVMGGTRQFRAARTPETNLVVAFHVEGAGIEVTPRLCVGPVSNSTDWADVSALHDGEINHLRRPAPEPDTQVTFELWDKFRVLRLFKQML